MTFKNISFKKSQHLGNPKCRQLSKRRAPTNDEDPLNKILKILDMGSIYIYNIYIYIYISNNMKWQFGNMGQIPFKSIRGFLNL